VVGAGIGGCVGRRGDLDNVAREVTRSQSVSCSSLRNGGVGGRLETVRAITCPGFDPSTSRHPVRGGLPGTSIRWVVKDDDGAVRGGKVWHVRRRGDSQTIQGGWSDSSGMPARLARRFSGRFDFAGSFIKCLIHPVLVDAASIWGGWPRKFSRPVIGDLAIWSGVESEVRGVVLANANNLAFRANISTAPRVCKDRQLTMASRTPGRDQRQTKLTRVSCGIPWPSPINERRDTNGSSCHPANGSFFVFRRY